MTSKHDTGCANSGKRTRKEEIGNRYGMLVVLSESDPGFLKNGHTYRQVLAVCDCGNEKIIALSNLRAGHIKSCGCQRRRISRLRATTHGDKPTNGCSTEYRSWTGAKGRCYNKNNRKYESYGGRGIYVCDRWLNSFENFLEDMGRKPSPNHSLDRKDNDGPYSPDNCRWADSKTQGRNKRNNVHWVVNGKKVAVARLAEKYNIKYSTIMARIKGGWCQECAYKTPVHGGVCPHKTRRNTTKK